MAIIPVVKYDGPPDVLAWKYPSQELSTWTQLIVNESQEAMLFIEGRGLDLFAAGRHTLTTQNVPVLTSFVKLPFGGKSPFTAEVWFVNKLRTLNVKWGTSSAIQLQDPVYQVPVSVRAFGQFGVQIEDSRKFLTQLIGTVAEFDQATLGKQFRSVAVMKVNELISSYMIHKKISILEINAYIGEISKHIEEQIAPLFETYGIRLFQFTTDSINIPEGDSVTSRLKDALAKKAEMNILGYTYHQERSYDVLQSAAQNVLFPGTLVGAGSGLDLGGDRRGHPSEAANRQGVSASECSECGSPIASGAKFCSECGDPYNPCPSCRADNPSAARHCLRCGSSLNAGCIHCGARLQAEAKFCAECGGSQKIACKQCHYELAPGQKFCPECGTRAE